MPMPPTAAGLPLSRLLGETRAAVLGALRGGADTIALIAGDLDLSEEAVRRHLRELEADGLVEGTPQHSGGRGRPSVVYRTTDRAHRLFPDRSADLANDLWGFLADEHGRRSVLAFLRWRQQRQAERYTHMLAGTDDVRARTEKLAQVLTDEGFAAETRVVDDGGAARIELTQSHCAVKDVAAEHPEVCAFEAALFRRVLGADLTRRETIAGGAARCVCTIQTPRDPPAAESGTDPA